MSTSTRPVFPAGYEPPGRDRDSFTHDDGTARYGLGYPTTHSYAYEAAHGKLWDGDTYLGGAHEVRDGYGTLAPCPPASQWRPAPRTWRTLAWDSTRSAECARSANVFVRLYGVYRDALAGFWSCPVHRHWGTRGGAGILPVAMVDGHPMVLLSHRASWVQHGGTWSTFGGAVDKGETPYAAAVREASEEASGLGTDGTVAGEHAATCAECGWQYVTYVVVTGIGPRDLGRVHARSSETREVAWVPDFMVRYYDLHPAFAQAWPQLSLIVSDYAKIGRGRHDHQPEETPADPLTCA